MRRCIELESIAKQRGESPVGALLALDGEVIAEGIESVKAKGDGFIRLSISILKLWSHLMLFTQLLCIRPLFSCRNLVN